MMNNEDPTLQHELIRINARAWGVAIGLLCGLTLLVATFVLVLQGGDNVGHHLGRLGNVLPGYDVTYLGGVIGFVYFFVAGYAFGRLISPKRPVPTSEARDLLASRHPAVHGHIWGIASASISAAGLAILTIVLILRGGDDMGTLLGHVGLYLPGYSVTWTGAAIGAAYLLLIGYVVGRVVAGLYNKTVSALG